VSWRRRFKVVGFLVGIGVLAFVGASVPQRLVYSPTPSEGARLFFRLASARPVSRGDYIVFPMKTDLIEMCRNGCLMLKQVQCLEGDYLETKGLDYYCNGRYLGTAKTKTLKGEPVVPFRYTGRIPRGKAFVVGKHKDSYDSRYCGFVDLDSVVARVVPII